MNIDVSKIEGYADMTPEQKVAALEGFSYEDHSADVERYKNAASKANSEAAEWKRKHNSLLGDEEKKAQETAEKYEQMEKEIADLRMEKLVASHRAKFLELGYTAETAQSAAEAMATGKTDDVFAAMLAHQTARDKSAVAEAIKKTPAPPAGNTGNSVNYADEISKARQRGDYASAAYFIRKQQEEQR